jgi:hypothetical protein
MDSKMSTIKHYTVTLQIQCEGHPRKWIIDTIAEALGPGEDITDFEITEVDVEEADNGVREP